MGLRLFGSNSDSHSVPRGYAPLFVADPQPKSTPAAPDPDPRKFSVKQKLTLDGNMIVVRINYEGCTTYGGDKILVYDDRDKFHMVLGSGYVDPHFLDDSYSPIARFEATDRGWDLAVAFAKMAASHLVRK